MFLPLSKKDLTKRGWDDVDVVLVTGDAYVDHPSYGVAVIGRVLEGAGLRVAMMAQPDWRSADPFKEFGRPRLFFGVTAGNLDSMVANYTAHKKTRKRDEYSPGGKPGLRPDRAVIVYCNRIREAFGDIPIVLGGIEASLRRIAHYDWWGDSVRRSILLDARADILVYGMGERQVTEIAKRLRKGKDLSGIRGTALVGNDLPEGALEIPSFEEVRENGSKFNQAFRLFFENGTTCDGPAVAQRHGNRYVIQYPPPKPLSPSELDRVFELPYERNPHPVYEALGGIPGFETVRFSLISNRGCCGDCSFCSLSLHQGKVIQSRSIESVTREARLISERPDFKGTITDVGGPTANLYGAACGRAEGPCSQRSCMVPTRCRNFRTGYRRSLDLYRALRGIPRVKHVFIESGIRYDLLTEKEDRPFLAELCLHHVSGQMKVAPEHTQNFVVQLMNKPPIEVYERFEGAFNEVNQRLPKKRYLVRYLISSHPGATLDDALQMALYFKKRHIHPEQVQDFMPLPLTRSTCMYHTGRDPFTGAQVYVARSFRERKMQRALLQWWSPQNKVLVKEALRLLERRDLWQEFKGGKSSR
ncbi:MAG TPA: YgiQ family radical SAM protein [Deltaproteobacteria bacterium]|nr:YgiQ family radical SAM protein [Deltaproteobacteria bacterium]